METVLVVEDSRPMQRLSSLFESDGLAVHIAATALPGSKAFATAPSVVVLDLKLPKMPGKEVCRAFKPAASVRSSYSAPTTMSKTILLLELAR